jgi:hypothetical protein
LESGKSESRLQKSSRFGDLRGTDDSFNVLVFGFSFLDGLGFSLVHATLQRFVEYVWQQSKCWHEYHAYPKEGTPEQVMSLFTTIIKN